MPRDTESAGAQGGPSPAGPGSSSDAAADTRPGGGLGTPIDTPDPLNKYKWWILGGIALALAIAAGFLLRKPADSAPSSAPSPQVSAQTLASNSGNTLLGALKDELFAIETDHVQGKLSDSAYKDLKSALELVLRRALQRSRS